MLNLVLSVFILLFLALERLAFGRKPIGQEQVEKTTKHLGMQNALSKNTLANILQIRRPVGVDTVRSPGIPSIPEALFTFPLVETSALKSLSEGNRCYLLEAEVIFCDYSEFSREFHIRFIPFTIRVEDPKTRGFSYPAVRYWEYPSTQKDFFGNECCGCCLILPFTANLSPREGLNRTETSKEKQMRHNLMMTASQVLVAWNPTDEDSFGKSRNLGISDESLKDT